MRFTPTKNELWILVFLLTLLCVSLAFSGCKIGARPDPAPLPETPGGPTVAAVLGWLSVWGAFIGGAGLLALPILARFGVITGGWAIQGVIACLILIVSSVVLAWVGSHLWLMVVACAVLGLVLGWVYRHKTEKWLGVDIDRNGQIGR